MKATIRQGIIDDGLLIPVQYGNDWVDGNIHEGPFEARYDGCEFQILLNEEWTEAISTDFEID